MAGPSEERRRPLAELNLLTEVNLLAQSGPTRRRRGCRLVPLNLLLGLGGAFVGQSAQRD